MTVRTATADLLADAAGALLKIALRLNPAGGDQPARFGIRIVPDEDYEPELAGEDEESREWLAKELDQLRNGELAAYGFIVITECPCCGNVDEVQSTDGALWGIVLDPAGMPEWDKPFLREQATVWDLTVLPDEAAGIAQDVLASIAS